MTPDELRALADEAERNTHFTASVRLDELAPDLARLCAELADAAEQIIRCGDREELRSLAEAARYDLAVPLARLSELKPVT